MSDLNSPIGVFDSGVGGISVLKELVKQMPDEDYIYLGDSDNAPYGTKPLEMVRELTFRNIDILLNKGAKAIAVACNTATSAAVADLRRMYPELPLVGIEPAIKPAVLYKEGSRIIVMATPMTLMLDKFKRLMDTYKDRAEIIPLSCPGLMEFVELGNLSGDDLHKYLTELFWTVSNKKIDSIVLGCTHYPFVKSAVKRVVGEEVAIFDGGEGTAREMKRRLNNAELLKNSDRKGQVTFINSRNTEEELKLCRFLLEGYP